MSKANGKKALGVLTERQLEIVMHLCNGLTIKEASEKMNYSEGNINRVLATARRSVGAKTTFHLIGIVMARDMLVYTPDENDGMPEFMVVPDTGSGPAGLCTSS